MCVCGREGRGDGDKASMYVKYLVYCESCDALVFNPGVESNIFDLLKSTVPGWILWKARETWLMSGFQCWPLQFIQHLINMTG